MQMSLKLTPSIASQTIINGELISNTCITSLKILFLKTRFLGTHVTIPNGVSIFFSTLHQNNKVEGHTHTHTHTHSNEVVKIPPERRCSFENWSH